MNLCLLSQCWDLQVCATMTGLRGAEDPTQDTEHCKQASYYIPRSWANTLASLPCLWLGACSAPFFIHPHLHLWFCPSHDLKGSTPMP